MLLRWFEARITGPSLGTLSPPSTRIRNQTRISGFTTAPAIRNPRSGSFPPLRVPAGVSAGGVGASPGGTRGASRLAPPVISGGWLWRLR